MAKGEGCDSISFLRVEFSERVSGEGEESTCRLQGSARRGRKFSRDL